MARAAVRWLPPLWSLLLTLFLLGPALAPGYVLTYDMVWVPDLTLRSDFLGLDSALPRAVPSDAVVAALDEVVPGMLLQKVVLVGGLLAAGVGASRLAPQGSLPASLVAVSVYLWNPFVVERLAMGHWPVLLGYAVLPWVVQLARTARAENRLGPGMWLLGVVGSLSAGAGLVTAVVVLALTVRRGARRLSLAAVAMVTAVNAPWVVAGLLHADTAASSAAGARAFALNDAGPLPAPLAALGLGGTWNVEVLLPSRESFLPVVALLLVLVLVALGARPWWRASTPRERGALLGCWALGWTLAVTTWASPALVGWIVETVPGGGLVRDGSRVLALTAPVVAALCAHGAAGLVRVAGNPTARTGVSVALVLAPIAVLPDASSGLSGRLQAVDYPSAYVAARAEVRAFAEEELRGDVLVLPYTSYRAPDWNGGRKVLDPLGRYLPLDYVAADTLVVSGVAVPGEDPRARAAGRALAAPTADARAARLAELGIGLVVHDELAGRAPDVSGTPVGSSSDVSLSRLAEAKERQAPLGWKVAMSAAWLLFVLAICRGIWTLAGLRKSRHADSSPGGSACYRGT